jgi:PAS domain S-box-containing protein
MDTPRAAEPSGRDEAADPTAEIAALRARVAELEAHAGELGRELAARRATGETYRVLLDESSDPIFMFRADGEYRYVNRAFATGVGRDASEIIGRTIWDVFPQEEAERRFATVKWVFEHGETRIIEVRVPRPDGDRHYLTTVKPVFGPAGEVATVICISKEITDRIRAEEELREREARQSLIFRMSSDAIGVSKDGVHTLVNPAYAAMFGYERAEDLVGVPVVEMIAEPERPRVAEYVARRRRGEPVPSSYEVRARRRDGSTFLMEVSGSTYELRGEVYTLVVLRDVTAQRRAERELAESEQRYRTIVELSPIGIAVHRAGIVAYANPTAVALAGVASVDEIVGRPMLDLVHPDDRAAVVERVRTTMTDGSPMPNREERFLRLDGEVIDVEAQGAQITYEGSPAIQVLFRDITERKRAEATESALRAQLFESQKMEAIGTLAGGIAHELNNVLAMIMGNVALARQDAPRAPDALASLGEIDRAAVRARDLVQQILTFSRRQPRATTAQPLRPTVEETIRLLRATLPTGVTLAQRISSEPIVAKVNANQIEQVIMNLCTNAWHALGGRAGRIEIGLERVDVPVGRALRAGRLRAGPYARLWVSDSGDGMDDAVQARMFEPFFTTKPAGEGTGLGLAVVHGIVAGHEGAIDVESARGEGTTVSVYLALHEGAAEPRHSEPPPQPARGDGQRVLYVDDEEPMVFLVQRLLERLGYQAVGVESAEAALEAVRAAPDAFDVVVTDYNMPRRSGLELARDLARVRADLPVVITSGYVTDELRADAARAGVAHVIDKQSSVEALCETLHALLTHGALTRSSAPPG